MESSVRKQIEGLVERQEQILKALGELRSEDQDGSHRNSSVFRRASLIHGAGVGAKKSEVSPCTYQFSTCRKY